MQGTYPVIIEGEARGQLRVTAQAALTLFEAEAEDTGGILRLSVYGGGSEGYLGVMSPDGAGGLRLTKRLSRLQLRGFPERIEYAGPSGGPRAAPSQEPEPAPEPAPGPEPAGEDDRLWYASPDGTLSSFDGERLLVALPAADPRVPAWAGDLVRVINGRKYVVFPW